MSHPPRTLVLFDIDWTLLNFGADREVLREVLQMLTGDPVLHALDPTGRSDGWVVAQLAEAAGVAPETLLPRYLATYGPHLEARLARDGVEVLPGVAPLLDVLVAHEGVTVGIATGNLRASAEAKLRHARLEGYFDPLCGGFGDVRHDRTDVVADALREFAASEAARTLLLGDTDLDMRAARANGIAALGVATGRHNEEALRASGAHEVFPDLDDTDRVLATVLGGLNV